MEEGAGFVPPTRIVCGFRHWLIPQLDAMDRPVQVAARRIGSGPTSGCACRRCWPTAEHGSLGPMSAVLIAAFSDHAAAEQVRTRLVQDGFPTDRVQLTSSQELGQAKLVPRASLEEKLTEYFGNLLQDESRADSEPSARLFKRAVLDGKAAVAVQPRGDVETQRALQLLNDADPVEVRGVDLQNQALEHAATESETPVVTWMGKVLAAPGAPDTTGLPKLP
jgi:hypothetical protein